jgi:hypothetical protein
MWRTIAAKDSQKRKKKMGKEFKKIARARPQSVQKKKVTSHYKNIAICHSSAF